MSSDAAPLEPPPVVEVSFDRHVPGEYTFTPGRLTLSIGLRRCPVEMCFDGRVWEGTPTRGDIKVMPEGQRRVFRHRHVCEFVLVEIDARHLPQDLSAEGLRPTAALRDLPISHAIDALVSEHRLGPTTRLFQQAIGTAIVARLQELDGVRHAPEKRRLPDRALSRVIEYIHAHLDEDVSVGQLAAVAGLSPAHFSTLFRNSTGEPPHRYLTRRRVERARELILRRGARETWCAFTRPARRPRRAGFAGRRG